MKKILLVCLLGVFCAGNLFAGEISYQVVDTGQSACYDNKNEIASPLEGESFYGQDALYDGNQPKYKDNSNGTVTDMVTGLMWVKDPGAKLTLSERVKDAASATIGGYTDWRIPTIKELYSLIDFSGIDPDPKVTDTYQLKPFINPKFFSFKYGNVNKGERIIDSQFISSTKYVHKTMHGADTIFGVNFADGRIKGYPLSNPKTNEEKKFYCLYVRGNPNYGKNKFIDNQNGTVTDKATGLMWMQLDSGHLKAGEKKDGKLNWQQALAWAENLDYAGYSDWRLPNAKELQSIVDYSKAPSVTATPAIAEVFQTSILYENNKQDYPYFWTSTTHRQMRVANAAVYISFGRGQGWMESRKTGQKMLLDVHGAGCQRSDPKVGNPDDFPYGRGPQGDVIRVYNFVRAVRGGKAVKNIKTQNPASKSSAFADTKESMQEFQNEQKRPPKFVERLDKNGDGKVSKDEFDGPAHHFAKFDKNNDNYISQSEAPKGPPNKRP